MLAVVRENGWAAEREEAVIGEASIAAPIYDRRGDVTGAIGVVGGIERIFSRRRPPARTGHPRARGRPGDHPRPRRRPLLTMRHISTPPARGDSRDLEGVGEVILARCDRGSAQGVYSWGASPPALVLDVPGLANPRRLTHLQRSGSIVAPRHRAERECRAWRIPPWNGLLERLSELFASRCAGRVITGGGRGLRRGAGGA